MATFSGNSEAFKAPYAKHCTVLLQILAPRNTSISHYSINNLLSFTWCLCLRCSTIGVGVPFLYISVCNMVQLDTHISMWMKERQHTFDTVSRCQPMTSSLWTSGNTTNSHYPADNLKGYLTNLHNVPTIYTHKHTFYQYNTFEKLFMYANKHICIYVCILGLDQLVMTCPLHMIILTGMEST